MNKPRYLMGAVVFSLLIEAPAAGTQAAELKLFSNPGSQPAIGKIIPAFEQSSGNKVNQTILLSVPMKRQIDADEAFDVAILAEPKMIDDLIQSGRAKGEPKRTFARVGVAIITKAEKTVDIGTVDALKQELLKAKTIAVTREASPTAYFRTLIDRLGIGNEIEPKLKEENLGEGAKCVIAGGCDFFVSLETGVSPEFRVTPFPSELQHYEIQTAVISAKPLDEAVAVEFMKFLGSPGAVQLVKSVPGMEAVGPSP